MWAVGKQWGGMHSGCVPCKPANEQSRHKGGGMRAMQQGARRGQGACTPSSMLGEHVASALVSAAALNHGALIIVVPGMSRSDRMVEVHMS